MAANEPHRDALTLRRILTQIVGPAVPRLVLVRESGVEGSGSVLLQLGLEFLSHLYRLPIKQERSMKTGRKQALPAFSRLMEPNPGLHLWETRFRFCMCALNSPVLDNTARLGLLSGCRMRNLELCSKEKETEIPKLFNKQAAYRVKRNLDDIIGLCTVPPDPVKAASFSALTGSAGRRVSPRSG